MTQNPASRRPTRFVPTALVVVAVMACGAAASAQTAAVQGDAGRGAQKTSMCTGCHGIEAYRASFPAVYTVPSIAGQSERYIASALEAYRKGDRMHPTMRGIAGSLSDQDIADLAAFYGRPHDAK